MIIRHTSDGEKHAVNHLMKQGSISSVKAFMNVSSSESVQLLCIRFKNQSRTNGPINAHLTIAQVMPRYNHNNEKQEALL